MQEPIGFPVTGNIGEGNGSGFQVIGRESPDPMQSGFPVTGMRDLGGGSGSKGIGTIDDGLSRSLSY